MAVTIYENGVAASALTITVGFDRQLTAVDTLSGTITWTSSNPARATVVAGLVHAIEGDPIVPAVYIRATSSVDGAYADCTLAIEGISTGLVGTLLGLGVSDIGLLCANLEIVFDEALQVWKAAEPHVQTNPSRINKWAKFKPFAYSSTGEVYGTAGNDTTNPKSVNYGLTMAQIQLKTATTSLYNFALGNAGSATPLFDPANPATNKKWAYNPPTGGEPEPYRLGDFRGYAHTAVPAFNVAVIPTEKYVTLSSGHCYWEIDLTPEQVVRGLLPSDFTAPASWHVGLMLIDWERDSLIKLLAANPNPLSVEAKLTVDLASIGSSTYLACLFLYYNDLAEGIAQITNPSSGDIGVYASANVVPLEDSVKMMAVINQFIFPYSLWQCGTPAGFMLPSAFASSTMMNLYVPSASPSILTGGIISWTEFNQYFSLHPWIADTSPRQIVELVIPMYFVDDDPMTVSNPDVYFNVCQWRDTDGNEVFLFIKTSSAGKITLRVGLMDSGADGFETTGMDIAMSTNSASPTVIKFCTHYETSPGVWAARPTISVNGTIYAIAPANSDYGFFENPVNLSFGYYSDYSAPKGIEFKSVLLQVAGTV